jgi:hypothetical protein
MDTIIGIILSIVVAFVLILAFYFYMNIVRNTYIDYDSNKITKLPWYTPPRWIKDAWNPTWTFIQRNLVILKTKI